MLLTRPSVRFLSPFSVRIRWNSTSAVQWFYATDIPDSKPPEFNYTQSVRPKEFLPFAKFDSQNLEKTYQKLIEGDDVSEELLVQVNEDNLFECDLREFVMRPTYWSGAVYEIRRGLWFHENLPLPGPISDQLEQIFLHSPEVQSKKPIMKELTDEIEYLKTATVACYSPSVPDKDLSVQQVAVFAGKSVYLYGKGSKFVKLQMDLFADTTFVPPVGSKKVTRGYQGMPKGEAENKKGSDPSNPTQEESILDFVKTDWLGLDNSNEKFKAEVKGDYTNEPAKSENAGDREVDHLVFCVHGIGQSLGTKIDSVNFIHTCNNLRKGIKSVYQGNERLIKMAAMPNNNGDANNCKVQVLPIIWRYNVDFSTKRPFQGADEQRLPSLDDITVDNIRQLRSVLGDVVLDILLYYVPEYKTQILESVIEQSNSLYEKYLEKNPNFKGKVSLLGHSLGSAIFFDILASQPDKVENFDRRKHLAFDVENYFSCGSPVSVFKLLKKQNIASRSQVQVSDDSNVDLDPVQALKVNSYYNIFYSTDPVAYRCEPMMDLRMKDFSPQSISFATSGINSHIKSLTSMGDDLGEKLDTLFSGEKEHQQKNVNKKKVPEELRRKMLAINRNGRVDYVMPERLFELSLLSALGSHIQYFEDEDFAGFLLQELYKS
ncbi:unnamed protein product [Kuraishia capsulata CBS 1993]|uniref:DDHD domain-containing protein n=1 Tax=Kuraishia capsulata CBS 1993 TaxID=1382522 RepID=W6MJY4_9ASCO|nr:uncharacterized protein KUCA_T00000829001 [Kuraishia capsulata CBS 1993]CDK24862.1 unnamed protein product [Kuraishia capsulata CBS 1993]